MTRAVAVVAVVMAAWAAAVVWVAAVVESVEAAPGTLGLASMELVEEYLGLAGEWLGLAGECLVVVCAVLLHKPMRSQRVYEPSCPMLLRL